MAQKKRPETPDTPNASSPTVLQPLREAIDGIDDKLIVLLNERAKVAAQIGDFKARADLPAYVPERERQVLERLLARSPGPLPADSLRLVYKEIISACLAMESPVQVAYVGPEATLHHAASKQHFGLSAQLRPMASIGAVFSEVERGGCDYGVVPMENTQEGIEHQTLERFLGSDLRICAEVLMRSHYHLLTYSGNVAHIDKVYAQPETAEPCGAWLQSHLPGVPVIYTRRTSQAAQRVHEGKSALLVGSSLAATLYDLQIAARNLESTGGHFSRFLVLGYDSPAATDSDRTSIMFAIQQDAPGVLYKALKLFAEASVNLTRIESRPSRRRDWEYLFFIDLDGHVTSSPLQRAIEELDSSCVFLQVLGSYPQGSGGPTLRKTR